jgi:hypothetical protein
MVTRFSIIALTLTLPFAAVAQNDLTPSSVMAEIQESGASATVFQLYEDNSLWSALLKNIENGKPAWLKVASVLRGGSDAGASEQLVLAVGEALEHNPEAVLEITVSLMGIGICGAPDVDDSRYDSYALSIAAIERRKAMVAKVLRPDLESLRGKCMQELELAKKGIGQFYGMQN